MARKAKKKAPAKKSAAKKAPAKKAPPAAVDIEARAALVSLGTVMEVMYPSMPSQVDDAYGDFMARVRGFDGG